MAETTMIRLSTSTRDKLKEMGHMGESYDDVINRLYEKVFMKKLDMYLMDTADCIDVEDMQWSE